MPLITITKNIFTVFNNNMKIQKTSINFNAKYPTGRVLEVTSQKIFEPDGVTGYIETLKQIHGNVPRYTGHQGYKRYAMEVGDKIIAKYPEIAKATKDIAEIAENNKYYRTSDLKKLVQPILDRFGKEVDIVI